MSVARPLDATLDATPNPVLQLVPLGQRWPTLDPFLFCVHHHDDYPAGDGQLAPAAPLDGRDLGQDFSGRDGWSMYHGRQVPGFPAHPHRGFETVTYVRRGLIDHSDSLGATARFGPGDAQWLTAGRGIVHAEMFPLVGRTGPNPLELFQLWLNLPAGDKLADPCFAMLWAEDVPVVRSVDDAGRATEVTVVAGALGDVVPPAPPLSSYAARPEADVAIWHVRLEAGARWRLPAATGRGTSRVLYVHAGTTLQVAGTAVGRDTGVVVDAGVDLPLVAGDADVEVLLLQGRPIGEPVAQHGPFVMTTPGEVEQAFRDYRATGFGGWPWADEAPTHGGDRGRFARHVDGRVEEPGAAG